MATVITFLSSSPTASRSVLRKIQKWITAPCSRAVAPKTTTDQTDVISFQKECRDSSDDALTRALLHSNPLLKLLTPEGVFIHSQALRLPNDSLLHCLSLHTKTRSDEDSVKENEETFVDAGNNHKSSELILFAIQSLAAHSVRDCSTVGDPYSVLLEARNRLATALQAQAKHVTATSHSISSLRILRSAWTGGGTSSDLIKHTLPIIDLEDHGDVNRPVDFDEDRMNETWNRSGALKEIVIPTFTSDTYPNGHSLLTALQQSCHVRQPLPGLYQLPQGLCIRPLPAAPEDRRLPPPSLIFHTESLLQTDHRDPETTAFKIGFTGVGTKGQLMLRDKSYNATNSSNNGIGVDVRLCASTRPSSMFSEAHESLLASSLHELQSVHVLNPTHKNRVNSSAKNASIDEQHRHQRELFRNGQVTEDNPVQRQNDPNTNKMDCWVEFRANMKHPQGFLSRK